MNPKDSDPAVPRTQLRHPRPRRVRRDDHPQGHARHRVPRRAHDLGHRQRAPRQRSGQSASHVHLRDERRPRHRRRPPRQRRALDQSFLRAELQVVRGRRRPGVHRGPPHDRGGRGAHLRLPAVARRPHHAQDPGRLRVPLRRGALPRLAAARESPGYRVRRKPGVPADGPQAHRLPPPARSSCWNTIRGCSPAIRWAIRTCASSRCGCRRSTTRARRRGAAAACRCSTTWSDSPARDSRTPAGSPSATTCRSAPRGSSTRRRWGRPSSCSRTASRRSAAIST